MMIEGVVPGHFIFATGIQVDPAKIKLILKLHTPHTPTQVRIFLGYVGYYCRFIAHFPNFSAPLYALTRHVEFEWTNKCAIAFENIKKLVSTTLVLWRPNWSLPSNISSDASNTMIGAVLAEEEDKKSTQFVTLAKTSQLQS